MNTCLLFVALSFPVLFQAGQAPNLFKTELLVDEEEQDSEEDNEDSNCREEPNRFRSNWKKNTEKRPTQ